MNKSKKNINEKRTKYPSWFYLVLIMIPVVFFMLLEFSLRIINYGRNYDQWIYINESKQMLNPEIAGRYFSKIKDLPQSNNDAFEIIKKENTFRVFVMGGSSAAGFPYSPNGSFSRYIRDRLELLYPQFRIEVINIAISATNSFTIRDMIPEVIKQRPDLILIYAGHNEYYGAFGIGSTENIGTSRDFVNFLIWLNKFKSVELLRNILSSATSFFNDDLDDEIHQGGTLMARMVKEQLIPFNSDSYNSGLHQFEGNFEDIFRMIKDAGIPVIIGSLVSNLKDQKPFESVNESESADSIYKLALVQLKLNKTNLADSLFRLAKDLDALRFRAPERINSIIKNLAIRYNCGYVDIDSVFNANSPESIIGSNLIADHLHPTLKGYFLMGKIYLEVMQNLNFLPRTSSLNISETLQDSIVVNNFAFTRLDSTIAEIRLTGLLNDWPFVQTPDFSFLKKINLEDRIDSIAFKISVENMSWEKGHREAADWYLSKKDYLNFAKEFLVLVSQYPFKYSDYEFAASHLINVKEYDLAYTFLIKYFKENPSAFPAKWLGNINLTMDNIDEAIKYLKESIRYDSSDAQVFYNLAGAYIQKQEFNNAMIFLDKCMSINTDYPGAQKLKVQLTEILSK